MSEAKDYGEPWEVYYDEPGVTGDPYYDPFYVARDRHNTTLKLDDLEGGESRTRGLRAVDCVNACAGMADPAAEITRLREAATWRPIETAPRDGSLFLVWTGELDYDGYRLARWWDDDDHEDGGHVGHEGSLDPTHWAPLPHAPADGGPRPQPEQPEPGHAVTPKMLQDWLGRRDGR